MNDKQVSFDDLVSLSKRRGIAFPSSDIYGGIQSTWDYGYLGTEMKRNIRELWWKNVVQKRDNVFAGQRVLISSSNGVYSKKATSINWIFEKGPTGNHYAIFSTVDSNLALVPEGNDARKGRFIVLWDKSSSGLDPYMWNLTPAGDSSTLKITHTSGVELTTEQRSSIVDGGHLMLWDNDSPSSDFWNLRDVDIKTLTWKHAGREFKRNVLRSSASACASTSKFCDSTSKFVKCNWKKSLAPIAVVGFSVVTKLLVNSVCAGEGESGAFCSFNDRLPF